MKCCSAARSEPFLRFCCRCDKEQQQQEQAAQLVKKSANFIVKMTARHVSDKIVTKNSAQIKDVNENRTI